MDFNGDGQHDWKDHIDAYSIYNMANEDSSFNNAPTGNAGYEISPLGKGVIIITIILCVFMLFTGSAEAIETLLGFGAIAFLVAQWMST